MPPGRRNFSLKSARIPAKKLLASGQNPSLLDTLLFFKQALGDARYLDVIQENIEKAPGQVSYVAMRSGCKPDRRAYALLSAIYINSDDAAI